MNITAKDIQALRQETGAGMMDAKRALTDAGGDASYPIAGMSFAVLYQKQHGAQGKAVTAFLTWCTGPDGQKLAKLRNYAPLPEELQKKVHEKLETVQVGK